MAVMKSCDEWKPFIAMIAIDFCFAIVNILLKKVLDEGMNHLVLITYRLTISTIFLAPISYFRERTSITQYFFLLGIQYTSATFACAFINMVPMITFIMALPFGLETVNLKCNSGRAKVIGTLVCIGGAFILTLYKGAPLFDHSKATTTQAMDHGTKLSHIRNKERWTIGSIALVVGTLLWSSWFLVQSNISKMYPCQYSSTTIMTFFGAIQSAILGFCTGRNLSMWVLRGRTQVITVLFSRTIDVFRE
ncbi:hypothetical protein PRUPE_5G135800 [Prunus persica]|uniref:Uncharacterized protein n=1 Tax=Prunus persica TaxID=3760 RepID=A0A251P817_PRUPE|nr:hypothetical protein PRUPE_5G135800 [Prunus persica]ONI07725.1 hypothetical protein PRUPE_5G135800 [Prunus persica]